ncbi:unnamed protein product [Pleuronectes platessa]|uniref:Uncharacterized protein n=1 Tax=Pleuronectes platessa TaxID=8262 RepID=A0A9N7Z950_PLEPL|nr:unnamed protein product [Pleuronectes platessa]
MQVWPCGGVTFAAQRGSWDVPRIRSLEGNGQETSVVFVVSANTSELPAVSRNVINNTGGRGSLLTERIAESQHELRMLPMSLLRLAGTLDYNVLTVMAVGPVTITIECGTKPTLLCKKWYVSRRLLSCNKRDNNDINPCVSSR